MTWLEERKEILDIVLKMTKNMTPTETRVFMQKILHDLYHLFKVL